MESLTELHDPGDAVAGETLIAVGRKISKVHLIPQTSAHRAQAVYVCGKLARCFIDISIRLLSSPPAGPQILKWRDPTSPSHRLSYLPATHTLLSYRGRD